MLDAYALVFNVLWDQGLIVGGSLSLSLSIFLSAFVVCE